MAEIAYHPPQDVLNLYIATKQLPDGRWIGVRRLLYHWTLHIDIDDTGYSDRYCFNELSDALTCLNEWDGQGDPSHRWHKHPASGRRRDPETGLIWSEREPDPREAKSA